MTISSSFATNLQIIQEYAFVICFNGKGFEEIYAMDKVIKSSISKVFPFDMEDLFI
jgi:hypothetical protein